jgi:putative transposase
LALDAALHGGRGPPYFDWYNFSHHHSGLAGFTPDQVFTGRYKEVAAAKQAVLDVAYRDTPERFVKGRPRISMPPEQVTINPVTPEQIKAGESVAVNFPTLTSFRQKNELILN